MLIRQGSFNSEWLCYAMNTRTVRFQVEMVQYGAVQEQFNISHAVNFWVGFCSKTQLERFRRSADSGQASGLDARHAAGSVEPPPDPMTIDEGRVFVQSMLLQALRARVTNAPSP
jgi:hypothetical protein